MIRVIFGFILGVLFASYLSVDLRMQYYITLIPLYIVLKTKTKLIIKTKFNTIK